MNQSENTLDAMSQPSEGMRSKGKNNRDGENLISLHFKETFARPQFSCLALYGNQFPKKKKKKLRSNCFHFTQISAWNAISQPMKNVLRPIEPHYIWKRIVK